MFIVVEINGTQVPESTLVAICRGKDLRTFGPLGTPELASHLIIGKNLPQGKYVILHLELHL